MTQNNIEEAKLRIHKVLDSFKIGHGEITFTPGPSVTLYEFEAEIGVRMTKIRNLKDEFTAALKAGSVRIIAPIPERGTIGIEVPNKQRELVPMTDMLWSDEYRHTDMKLPLVLGRKVDNSIFMADLTKMPHLLVAGATGMGKSVGLNVIISSLLNKLTPDELKLVLIDPKQVELSVYEDIAGPYLAKLSGFENPIITEVSQAKETLDSVCMLMESRYETLKNAGVRNLEEYNELQTTRESRLPYYVVIIDEYGDLMMTRDGRDLETAICRIAQKARAVGIHMIISTQRPSATIVTGNIKANFPTRIAFRTTTGTDSRVILDRQGAERLAGNGDMLFFNGGENVRVQCAYVSTDEVLRMCSELKEEYSDYEITELPSLPAFESPRIILSDMARKIALKAIDKGNMFLYKEDYQNKPEEGFFKNDCCEEMFMLRDIGFITNMRYDYLSQKFIWDIPLYYDKEGMMKLIEEHS